MRETKPKLLSYPSLLSVNCRPGSVQLYPQCSPDPESVNSEIPAALSAQNWFCHCCVFKGCICITVAWLLLSCFQLTSLYICLVLLILPGGVHFMVVVAGHVANQRVLKEVGAEEFLN